jgi:hypothetical protein
MPTQMNIRAMPLMASGGGNEANHFCAEKLNRFLLHIMSPNMMIARTRPLPFQQGSFLPLFAPG